MFLPILIEVRDSKPVGERPAKYFLKTFLFFFCYKNNVKWCFSDPMQSYCNIQRYLSDISLQG